MGRNMRRMQDNADAAVRKRGRWEARPRRIATRGARVRTREGADARLSSCIKATETSASGISASRARPLQEAPHQAICDAEAQKVHSTQARLAEKRAKSIPKAQEEGGGSVKEGTRSAVALHGIV